MIFSPIIIFLLVYVLLLLFRNPISRYFYYGDTAYINFLYNMYLKVGGIALFIYYAVKLFLAYQA